MSNGIDITISGAALDLLPRLKDDAGLGRAIARTMDYQNQITVARIQTGHLSGPTSDSSLSVRTNRLRGSVRASKALPTATGVVSSIGSNVVYAGIHEFGGVIKRTVKPGAVKLRTDKNGQLLRHGKNGKLATFAGGQHKRFKTVKYAGGKTYEIVIPARAPFGHGIADRADDYGAAVSSAIVDYWKGKNS
jgi:phage gpG-like protein